MTLDDLKRADVFDSRDVIERIEEIGDTLEAPDMDYEDDPAGREGLERELTILATLGADAGEEWPYGMVFVAEEYFTTYTQEFAEEVGGVDNSTTWPLYHIDWDAAAEELKMDYGVYDLDGQTFYAR